MFSARPSGVRLGVWRRNVWLMILIVSSELAQGVRAEFSYESVTAVLARINVSYNDSLTKKPRSVSAEMGRFADGAIGPAGGILVQGNVSQLSYYQGCAAKWASPPEGEPWVALLLRGGCSDEEKVGLAMAQNASAVLLFGGDPETPFQKDPKFKGDAVVIYLLRAKGHQLSELLLNGTKIYISITRGQEVNFRITSINRTSVLFVSVSFIVLMVVSLAWLIFYYIQRFRYINAKDRLARHLNNAAKKALAKIPVKNLKTGEREIEETESCAVCIEIYQIGDSLRSLPCKHQFHKSCVDPWLLEHRTCPMCKMDILKHYGYIQQNNTDGGGARTTAVDETVVSEGGHSRRNGEAMTSSNSRGTNSSEPLQVSVISQSEVLPRIDPQEQASSNPASDGPLTMPSFHPSCLSATPGVIRSMILSVRSSAPPQDHCGAQEEDGGPPISIFQDSSTVNPGGGQIPTFTNEEKNPAGTGTSSALPTAPSETSLPGEKPYIVVSIPEALPCQSSVHNRSSDYIVYDIECLVKEISELERDEVNSDKNDKQLPKQTSEISQDTEKYPQNFETDEACEGLKHLSSACIISPGTNSELPKVDCEPQTQILSINDGTTSYNYPTRLNRSTSSIPSEDGEDSKARESLTSSDERRSSAGHLIAITHS